MPRLTGIDLLKIVRTVPGLRHIPFLMITVESEKDRILQAIQEGVDNYVIKPFTSNVLEKKIKSTLFDVIKKNTE
jgi:two-component system chemotaxis response regulator CheY